MWHEWSTLKKLIWLHILQGASAIIKTVTGTAPLVLTNAVNKAITELTQYGKCVQNGTPTPDAPVDIVCNNGVLRMVDDELPSGYTRLQYLESDGTSGDSGSNGYVDTGIFINSIDTDVEIDFQLTDTYAPSPRMAWGYMGTPSSLPRWGFGAYGGKWLGSPNATAGAGEVDTRRHVAVMRVYTGGSNSAFYNGTLDGETLYSANNLGNVSIFEGNDRWSTYLFARNNNNTAANFVPCKIFRFKVYKAGALTHDLVPCKDGNGVLGFYDIVAATFSVASGTLIAGAADYSHAHIGADGTPEVLTVSATGAETQTVTDIPMLLSVGGTKDEAEIISGIKTGKVGIYVFTGEEGFTKGSAFYTTNTSFLPSKAGSITPICTHFEGISASASRVADSLTMTVNGPSGSFKGCVYFYADRSLYATAADFKAWLAEQYAAGTPVIVIYPLATPTTESVSAQPLHTSAGDNTVSVTSNVDPVELEVQYSATA